MNIGALNENLAQAGAPKGNGAATLIPDQKFQQLLSKEQGVSGRNESQISITPYAKKMTATPKPVILAAGGMSGYEVSAYFRQAMASYNEQQAAAPPISQANVIIPAAGLTAAKAESGYKQETGVQPSVWTGIKEGISSTFSRIKNALANFFMGTPKTAQTQAAQAQKTGGGFFVSVGEFFKDLGSAVTLGAIRPDGEEQPKGFLERLKFSLGKLKEAFGISK